ncbi:carbohydrate ABC transporter permease [Spelaeicoccus albus]|uniref:Multiple sugar transport system permease protein n=1 Tax=Spelaeicoccus albus TaxID=1280376 RepID=A0A7Z0D1G4_9MICO|nr:sugar ABC transporter permease [Spelaeicoccus albus]NYI66983.1 multiple sugar transport system permease protein [Spelaeicoccus albus]
MVYNIILSLQKLSPYQSPGDAIWVGLSNFTEIFTNGETASSAWNTAFWLTALTVAIRLVVGMAIALLLQSRVLARWKLRGVCRTAVLIPWMVPPVVAVACWKWILDANTGVLNQVLVSLGLVPRGVPFLADTSTVWWSIVAIVVWRELPFVVIVLMAGLQSIPQEQYEAAALDSAGPWKSFLHVTVPSLRPVITVVVIMTVIQTFNNFVYVWLTTGGGPGTYTQVLATQLYSAAFVKNDLGHGAAIGIVMSAIMAIFALVYFRVANRDEVRDV